MSVLYLRARSIAGSYTSPGGSVDRFSSPGFDVDRTVFTGLLGPGVADILRPSGKSAARRLNSGAKLERNESPWALFRGLRCF